MSIRAIIPSIPYIAIIVTALMTWVVTSTISTIRWKRTLRYHMPDIAKEQIQRLEAERAEALKQGDQYKKERDRFALKVKSAKAGLEIEP